MCVTSVVMEVEQPQMFGEAGVDCENVKIRKSKGGKLKTFLVSKRVRDI